MKGICWIKRKTHINIIERNIFTSCKDIFQSQPSHGILTNVFTHILWQSNVCNMNIQQMFSHLTVTQKHEIRTYDFLQVLCAWVAHCHSCVVPCQQVRHRGSYDLAATNHYSTLPTNINSWIRPESWLTQWVFLSLKVSIIGGPYSEWVLIPVMGLFIVKCHYQ